MTKPLTEHEIERELEAPAPEPPEELLAALRAEIPSNLAAVTRPEPRFLGRRRWQLAAAAMFVAVVGVVVVSRVDRDGLSGERFAARQEAGADRDAAVVAARPAATRELGAGEEPSFEGAAGPAPRADQGVAGETRDGDDLSPDEGAASAASGPLPSQAGRPDSPLGHEAEIRRQPAADEAAVGERDRTPGVAVDRINVGGAESEEKRSRPSEAVSPPPATPAMTAPPSPPPSRDLPKPKAVVADAMQMAGPPAATAEESPRARSRALKKELRALGYLAEAEPSTGGTAEPNDRPYGDMFFESAGVNPFIDTEDDALSTFGLDVDTGSYTVARSYLDRGHLPPADAIRVEEFVNFFSYGDVAPTRGDFALSAEGAPSPFAESSAYRVVRFGVHGREIDRADRKPALLVFVVDVSGSMKRDDRLGLVRRSLELLLDQLYPDDRVGLVVYGSRGEVLLEPTGDHESIRRAIDRLQPSGSTNAEEGLVLGYQLARRFFREGAINRVVLCSDGVANVGRTGADSILGRIAAAAEEGIELTTIGFGMGNYNDVLMEQLANRGDGRYAYVDSITEARRLFVEDLTGTLETIASDAKVQVEFDPEVVTRYRLLGYENRDIADDRFRDDTVDAGEIGAGHQVSAVYEIKLAPEARPRDRVARLSLRYRSAADGGVEEVSIELRARDLANDWDAASPGLRLASLVAELAEILRGSYWAREGDLGDLRRRAQELAPAFADDPKVAELVGLIAKAEKLQAAARPTPTE